MSNIGVDTLVNRINNVIEIHRSAEDITHAEIIGVLEIIKLDLHAEIAEDDE